MKKMSDIEYTFCNNINAYYIYVGTDGFMKTVPLVTLFKSTLNIYP